MSNRKQNKKKFRVATNNVATNEKSSKPTIWVTWITNPCFSYSQRKYRRERKTAVIPPFDKDTHNFERQKVAKIIEEKGFEVQQERPLFDIYKNWRVGHFFDIIASSKDELVAVEVKPTDKDCYNKQYAFAAAILDRNVDSFKYYVYEYKTEQFVQKVFPDFSTIRKEMNERVEIALDIVDAESVPSRYCSYFPFAKCAKHPQYGSLGENLFEVSV
jgi:Holliday junction resolvase-like predicted endonuclease